MSKYPLTVRRDCGFDSVGYLRLVVRRLRVPATPRPKIPLDLPADFTHLPTTVAVMPDARSFLAAALAAVMVVWQLTFLYFLALVAITF